MDALAGTFRLLYRVPWLLLHVLVATPLTILCHSPPGKVIRIGTRSLDEIMLRWWAGMTCRVFGVRRRIAGELAPGACLIAANHISWLDIQLLHSLSRMGFVAKAEISDWPVAGWLARLGGTVFHQRGSHHSASDVAEEMTVRLESGERVAIFPEGGILPGVGIKRFHARLFAAAIQSNVVVQPVMLRYLRHGEFYRDITFHPGEHFVSNFFRLLRQPSRIAEIWLLPPLDPAGKLRRDLAAEAETAVRSAFHGEPVHA